MAEGVGKRGSRQQKEWGKEKGQQKKWDNRGSGQQRDRHYACIPHSCSVVLGHRYHPSSCNGNLLFLGLPLSVLSHLAVSSLAIETIHIIILNPCPICQCSLGGWSCDARAAAVCGEVCSQSCAVQWSGFAKLALVLAFAIIGVFW